VPSWVGRVHRFDFSRLRQQYPNTVGTTLTSGNGHLPDLAFYEVHPEYDYCWTIEYDVRFYGSWAVFFEEFQNNTADLLGTHIRRYEDQPGWYWWGTLQTPDGSVAPENRVRAFLPVRRMSRQALSLLMGRDARGWHGHFEGLIPTLLSRYGLRLEDIGGNGPFTPPPRRSRFYSSFDFQGRGALMYFGSMRFRPALMFWGTHKNFLYHPIKSNAGGKFASAWNLVGCARYVLKHVLSRQGHGVLRDLIRYACAWLPIAKKRSDY